MLHALLEQLNKNYPLTKAQAHCDIPCKIYDPSPAQIAALTVLRMVDLIEETEKAANGKTDTAYLNSMIRFVVVIIIELFVTPI